MKPIHLNLAARPYRDYRPVYAVVVVASLLIAFLMLNNIETWYRFRRDTGSTRTKIAQLEAQTRQEKQREEIAERQLKTLDLAVLDAQTRFVNAKLSERAFSWSALLDELESVLAQDVRLISVAPGFNPDGTISLSLNLESKSTQGMITTINRMHLDPQFNAPFPGNETFDGNVYAFTLGVQFQPPALQTSAKSSRSRR
ncbi:MAG TPA: hypothetical protein VNA69_17275 [Thermoanaerobaculia bacterium]|nr:hypothetical protein [Thermoanaerobaculia bacterium]